MKVMKKQKGFTLIELLVVIAVIAILASVVFVNLRGAQESARDARITVALGQVRSISEIIYSRNLSYDPLCTSAAEIGDNDGLLGIKTDIAKACTSTWCVDTPNTACHATVNDYCVSVKLNEDKNYWCAMSDGRSGRSTSPCTSPTAGCF